MINGRDVNFRIPYANTKYLLRVKRIYVCDQAEKQEATNCNDVPWYARMYLVCLQVRNDAFECSV